MLREDAPGDSAARRLRRRRDRRARADRGRLRAAAQVEAAGLHGARRRSCSAGAAAHAQRQGRSRSPAGAGDGERRRASRRSSPRAKTSSCNWSGSGRTCCSGIDRRPRQLLRSRRTLAAGGAADEAHRRHVQSALALDLLWSTDGSVEALAKVLRDGFQAGDNPELVPIKAGTRRPLFVMFTIAGRLFFYYELARRLAPEQTVYGLQARGVFDAARPTIDRSDRGPLHRDDAQDAAGRTVSPGRLLGRRRGRLRGGAAARRGRPEGGAACAPRHLCARRPRGGGGAASSGAPARQTGPVAAEGVRCTSWCCIRCSSTGCGSCAPWPKPTVGRTGRTGRGRPPSDRALRRGKVGARRALADRLGWTRWAKGPIRVHRLPGGHADLVKPPWWTNSRHGCRRASTPPTAG